MKVRCEIEGLDCPHCALKLQEMIAKADQIDSVVINFPLKSVVMEVSEDADEEEIVAIVQKIADDFSDGITIDLRD